MTRVFRFAFVAATLAVLSAGSPATAEDNRNAGVSAEGLALFSEPVAEADKPKLREVFSRIVGPGVVRGDFAQTKRLASVARNLSSRGRFLVSKEDGIVWDTRKPFASLLIVGERGIIQRTSSGKLSRLDAGSSPVFAQFSEAMRAVFAGDADALFSRFDVYYRPGSTATWNVGLIPRDSVVRSVIASMELSGEDALKTFLVTEPTGDTVFYEFSSHSFSAGLADDEKTFFAR